MRFFIAVFAVVLAAGPSGVAAQTSLDAPAGKPEAVIDLATEEGVRLVKGQWRYSDTKIVEVDFRGPGPDKQPTGAPIRTYDFTPHAGGADFDDSRWEAIAPTTLDTRRSTGRLCFNWYRIAVTIPDRVGNFDPTGATVVFETSVDDYAEIWVDGELTRGLGQSGGSVVSGWNAPNRLVVGRNVKPGQKIQLAVFGINGPLSNPPTNFIFMRFARLEFHNGLRGPIASPPREVNVEVVRLDPRLDAIVPPNLKVYKLAENFTWVEGPVWNREGQYLLFSDIPKNAVYKWKEGEGVSLFLNPSGYSGSAPFEGMEPGSNGLTFDATGRLVLAQHGDRRIGRLEPDGRKITLADRYEGKRINSPNDLVFKSNGDLYFTDPPFGLPKAFDDPRKDVPFQGVYRLSTDGTVTLLIADIKAPNGLAFSPDEKTLYVSDVDPKRAAWLAYDVKDDGTVANGRVFFDATRWRKDPYFGPDGMKIDKQGNLFGARPGGISVFAPDGTLLGTIDTGQPTSNLAWGEDGATLYITGGTALYRIRLSTKGMGF
jgi:gluconolactonase